MKKLENLQMKIFIIPIILIISILILSACNISQQEPQNLLKTETNENLEQTTNEETTTIKDISEIKEINPEELEECDFSRKTYYNGEEWCTENGICYKNYEDFLEAQLQIYSDKLTEELNPGKYYEIDTRMIDPLFNPRIKEA